MSSRVYVEIRCNALVPLYAGGRLVRCSSALQVEGDRVREADRAAQDLGWKVQGKQGAREHYCKSHADTG